MLFKYLNRNCSSINKFANNSLKRYFGSLSGKKVLVSNALGDEFPQPGIDLLKQNGANIEVMDQEKDRNQRYIDLFDRVKSNSYDAILCCLEDKIDAEMINNSTIKDNTRVISTMSVGFNHISLNTCFENNINIGYTPEVLTETVADLVVLLTLATARNFVAGNASVYNGEWVSRGMWTPLWMAGKDVYNSKIGIVGYGRIGSSVAKRLSKFGDNIEILYSNHRHKPIKEATDLGFKYCDFETLLKESDFVIPLMPLTKETKGLFGLKQFKLMKNDAIFINCSRGDLVKQDELIDALKNNIIGAAGLDVTTPEPLPLDSELLNLNNCTILPHLGSASIDTRNSMAVLTAQNIIDTFEERSSKYLMTPNSKSE